MVKYNLPLTKTVIFFLLFVLLTVFIPLPYVFADDETNNENKSTVHIRAGHLKNEEGLIFLSGGLTIKRDNITLTSPEGEFDDDKNKIDLSNGVEMDYENGIINAREMTAWFDNNNFVFKKDVKMDYMSDNKKEKRFILESSRLQINSETRSFTANDNVVIDYEGKIIKGNKAKYDDEKELLTVIDNVHIREENGDWVKSDRAEFNLSSGEENFTADGNVEIEITLDDDNNKND